MILPPKLHLDGGKYVQGPDFLDTNRTFNILIQQQECIGHGGPGYRISGLLFPPIYMVGRSASRFEFLRFPRFV